MPERANKPSRHYDMFRATKCQRSRRSLNSVKSFHSVRLSSLVGGLPRPIVGRVNPGVPRHTPGGAKPHRPATGRSASQVPNGAPHSIWAVTDVSGSIRERGDQRAAAASKRLAWLKSQACGSWDGSRLWEATRRASDRAVIVGARFPWEARRRFLVREPLGPRVPCSNPNCLGGLLGKDVS